MQRRAPGTLAEAGCLTPCGFGPRGVTGLRIDSSDMGLLFWVVEVVLGVRTPPRASPPATRLWCSGVLTRTSNLLMRYPAWLGAGHQIITGWSWCSAYSASVPHNSLIWSSDHPGGVQYQPAGVWTDLIPNRFFVRSAVLEAMSFSAQSASIVFASTGPFASVVRKIPAAPSLARGFAVRRSPSSG